ncbi:MAG TPA: protease modulator HflC [Kiritimatiellia bacterium]|nr:protease modulator HflC [Kiritimatiellia bacterium]
MNASKTSSNAASGLAATGILIVLLLGFLAYHSLYTVNEWEQAIVVQFGEIKGDPVTEAGLHFKLPFVQKVHKFDRRLLRWDGRETTTITKDRKTINIDITARWRIENVRTFLETIGSVELAGTRLNGIIEGAVKDEIAKYDLYEVVRSSNRILDTDTEGLSTTQVEGEEFEAVDLASLGGSIPPLPMDGRGQYRAGRPFVIAGILREARQRLEQVGIGIHLEDVLIKQLNYSAAIEANVYAQMNAELQKISAGFRSIGRQRAEQRLGEMELELATIQSQAVEQSERIRGQAEAEAIRIYAEAFNQDPVFFAFLRTLQSYRTVLGANSSLILQTDSEILGLLRSPSALSAP